MARLVSKIYGEALYDFAKDESQLEKMYEEAQDIIDVFTSTSEAKDFLTNPKVSSEEKTTFVRGLFLKLWEGSVATSFRFFKSDVKKGTNPKILDFVSIVIKKGRQNELIPMLKHFSHLVLESKNVGEAEVASAVELSDEKKKKLEEKLISVTKYDNFIVDYKVDSSLIAGVKIKIDDKVFDKTYKTKIFDIQKSLRGLKL